MTMSLFLKKAAGVFALVCSSAGVAVGAAPTVTVTDFNAESGAFSLTLGARTTATHLFAVSADEDKGESLEGWEAEKYYGKVAADAEAFSGVLPRGMTMSAQKVRFIVVSEDDFPGTRVEYLSTTSNSKPYINTGIVPDANTGIQLCAKYSADMAPFGVASAFYLFANTKTSVPYGFRGKSSTINLTAPGTWDGAFHEFCLSPAGIFIDGVEKVKGPLSGTTAAKAPIALFGRYSNAEPPAIAKQGACSISSVVITQGGDPVRDYGMYKDKSGKGVLYDRINKKVYKSEVDDATFEFGPELPLLLTDAKAFAASEVRATQGLAVSATVKDLALTQVGSRRLKVTYTLENAADPVVVTARMLTNGVAVAGARLFGDISTEQTNGKHIFYWHSDDDIPNLATGGVKVQLKLWHTKAPPAYLVFDIRAKAKPCHYEAEADLPGGIGSDEYRTTRLVMRRVNARGVTFRMGAPVDEKVSGQATHKKGLETRYVTFSEDFYMGVFEFTQGQMLSSATNGNTSAFKLATNNQNLGRPLEKMAYDKFHSAWKRSEHAGHGVEDASVIGQLRKVTGSVIDLPTEAQWEFACRAGTGTAFYWGADGDVSHSRNNGNPKNNTTTTWNGKEATCSVDEGGTARVGSFDPNPWGFYDMSGNVWEMCVDSWTEGPFAQNTVDTPLVDPIVEEAENNDHVRRGGGWGAQPYSSTSSNRMSCQDANTGIGFRLICPVPYTKAWEK